MKKVEEFYQHAAECREMARTASPAHRVMLETMARTWDQLAESRKRQIDKIVEDSAALVIEFEVTEDPSKS